MSEFSDGMQMEIRGGSYEEGLANGRKLLDSHPEIALQQAQTLLQSGAEPRALHLAAAAWRRLQNPGEAEQCELSAIKVSFGIEALNAAAVAGREGRGEQARWMLEAFLREQPQNILALTMLAELEIDDWQLDRAEKALRGVLERAPTYLRAIMLLAKCLTNAVRVGEAIAVMEEVLTRKPQNATALQSLAQLYAEINEHSRAADLHARLLELAPTKVDTWILYAQELRILGRKEESVNAFTHALAIDPANGAAWWGLTYYFPGAITDADAEAMERALAALPDSDDSSSLHIALSVLSERSRDYAGAFRHVAEGKRSRARFQPYDAQAARDRVHRTIDALKANLESSHSSDKVEPSPPIFIVGMPRSGTTLLEQVLGRHSQIESCGELPILPRLEEILRHGGVQYPDRISELDSARLSELGAWYVDRSREYRKSNKPRFIDKLNFNWMRAGLIRSILPHARIIDLRRNALDCCWANFKMMFSEGHPASNDQRDIARFYRDYVTTIEAVDTAGPGAILIVRYEELVDDTEGQARRILKFLGLDYEPECLDFRPPTSAIATPSSEQVRRPINRDSIGSAEPYREWLGPMSEELGRLAAR